MNEVCEDHDPVVITRNRDQAVVMISLEDYESLEETAFLLRSPANARRLLESIRELEEGRGSERDADDDSDDLSDPASKETVCGGAQREPHSTFMQERAVVHLPPGRARRMRFMPVILPQVRG